jgi:hypothetical protein
VTPPTPTQVRRRQQMESLIRLASPALSALLAVGERVSRLVEPEDVEYYPPRVSQEQPPAQGGPGRTEP